jgi:hypothetical protein
MSRKRQIEVFTAGCPACDATLEMVNEIACPSCDVMVRDMHDAGVADRAPADRLTGSSITTLLAPAAGPHLACHTMSV